MIPNVVVALGVSVARIQHRGREVVGVQDAHVVIVLRGSALLLPGMGIVAVGVVWTTSQTILALLLVVTLLRPLLFRMGSGSPLPM